MLNLLPQTEKKVLKIERGYKALLILSITLLCALVCFILILLSIKISIAGQANAENIIFQQFENQIQKSKLQEIEDRVKAYNKNMADINSFYKDRNETSELLQKISEILPSDIYLTYFSFNTIEERVKIEDSNKTKIKINREISISGFSPSRERLFELKQILESQSDFNEVYFPASNWTKPYDIDFSLKFNL
jgi:Tfp pilus assembly protein PilN